VTPKSWFFFVAGKTLVKKLAKKVSNVGGCLCVISTNTLLPLPLLVSGEQ
jgi:hypothetical protein